MALLQVSIRRMVLVGGLALAAAAGPAVTVFSAHSSPAPAVACAGGEEPDVFSEECVPHTVPNSGGVFTSIPGNPDLPAVSEPGGGGEIPCTGANTGECIGLAEESASEGPAAVPHSSVESSPTITGSIG